MNNYINTNSSDIGMTCDVCGRTVQGCSIVNGMKFCAKCYQETFGSNKDWLLLDKIQFLTKLSKYFYYHIRDFIVPFYSVQYVEGYEECVKDIENFLKKEIEELQKETKK